MLFTDAYPYSIDFHLSISLPTLFFVVFSSPDFPSVGHVLLASFSQKGSVKIPRIVKFLKVLVASLTETCLLGYGLKDHFPLHKLVVKLFMALS